MKKVMTILAIVLTIVMVTACSTANDSSLSDWIFNEYSSGSVNSDNGDGSGNGNSSGSAVKPITGGGDFNAGNNYNK